MADHADDDGDNDVFVYMGGLIPEHLRETITRIHESIKIIRRNAFRGCIYLVSIEMHDGVAIIEEQAFYECTSLREIKLPGTRIIGDGAFAGCRALESVEFGDKLETIGAFTFAGCRSLRSIKIPKVRNIEEGAFGGCEQLTTAKFAKDLETMGGYAFNGCIRLRRVAMPLKDNLLGNIFVFRECDDLSTIDLVGGIHKTISSLLLDSWREEMKDEIERINRDLPTTPTDLKTFEIQQWMERVLQRIQHYKSEHYTLLKNNTTQLELALWDANLPNVDAAASRDDARVTCGANIIIPHVLSFLNDADEFPILVYDQATVGNATGDD